MPVVTTTDLFHTVCAHSLVRRPYIYKCLQCCEWPGDVARSVHMRHIATMNSNIILNARSAYLSFCSIAGKLIDIIDYVTVVYNIYGKLLSFTVAGKAPGTN